LNYTWLNEKLHKSCWNPSQYVNGPSQYAARILGEKTSERSMEVLITRWTLPRQDGPEPCAWRALQGLTLKGEEVVPLMLEVATDPEASSNNRYEAISWLGEMGSDSIRNFYCLPVWGCEQLGTEVGEEWVDDLIELLENDPDSNVRLPAAKALHWIGDPRGIEAIRQAYEVETDWRVLKALEEILKELDQ
jgi:HEAT repeat protein